MSTGRIGSNNQESKAALRASMPVTGDLGGLNIFALVFFGIFKGEGNGERT